MPCPSGIILSEWGCTLVVLPVGKEERSPAVLQVLREVSCIIYKFTFILRPEFLNLIEILVIDGLVEYIGVLII